MPNATPLLSRDASDGARQLALDWMDRVVAATQPLRDDPTNVEALHDVRVALTRLRATLRLYREPLDRGVGRRAERELRALHAALGTVRDLDVQGEWLAQQREALPETAREGADWLQARLQTKRTARVPRIRAALTRHLAAHVERWQHRLTVYTVTRVVGEPYAEKPLAATVAEQMHRAVQRLQGAIEIASVAPEQDVLHASRIAIKRLRALLVPWLDDVEVIHPLYATLSQAQDTLGDMRDAQLIAERARRAAERSQDHYPERATSLLALAHELEQLAVARRQAFTQSWLLDLGQSALADVPMVADAFADIARRGQEIERKFLLHSAPPHALRVPGVRIAQGWLPGERLRERLRRSVHPDGHVTWTRTVKVGTGVARLELEEATEPMLFESLWPLTAKARVEKVRHPVIDGGFTWEIDVFLDRTLVLAEVELPAADTPVELPDWLAPHVVREVTGEAEFVNATLARAVRRDHAVR